MKFSFALLVLLLDFSVALAQIKAVTETGEKVLLNENGTWKYANPQAEIKSELKLNPQKFGKSAELDFLVKSTKVNVGVWIDPKKWNFEKAESGEAAEFRFQHRTGDIYGMLISEKMEIPLETLKKAVLGNAKKAGPNVEIVKEEYRMVNGLKVMMLQMNGTVEGMEITYLGYYYSDKSGTVQFLTYLSQSQFDAQQKTLEATLNGLTSLDSAQK